MKRALAILDGFLALLVLAGCQTSIDVNNPPSGVADTWEHGLQFLPGKATLSGRIEDISFVHENPESWSQRVQAKYLKADAIVPAVIYVHGCNGPVNAKGWAADFSRFGFAFFAPNSFERPGRKSYCGSDVPVSSQVSVRTEEILYALDQVKRLPWVDAERIVLVGSSEGGHTAAAFDGDGFVAHILLKTDCRYTAGERSDMPGYPSAPSGVAVLNIVGSADHYGYGQGCKITRKIGGSRSIILEGAGHGVQGFPEAVAGVARFLEACCGYMPSVTDDGLDTKPKAKSLAIGMSATTNVSAQAGYWVDSSVEVVSGQTYKLSASGSWTVNSERCGWSGPDGGSGPCSKPLSFPQDYSGSYSALLGRIGDGPIFFVGDELRLDADSGGRLYFRINDSPGSFGNNEGSVAVQATLVSSP